MKAISFLGFVAVSNATDAPLTSLALTWKDCGGAAKITNVVPSTIPLGASTNITGSGESSVTVSGGNFAATVKAGWIPLASCSGPLGPAKTCALPLGAGSLTLKPVALPIQKGPASLGLSVQLAANLPAQLASTTTHATATSSSGQGLVCLDIYMKKAMVDEVPEISGGACSADDQNKINAKGGGDEAGKFPMVNEDCAKEALNFFKGIDQGKFDACMIREVKISSACAGCFWQSAQYGFENCKFSCMQSWCSSKCLDCTKPGGEKTNACAGFATTAVPVPCDAVDVAV